MTGIVARAPGKLVLTGEYAALCGGPALVAAIDRHVELRLRWGPGPGPVVVESRAENGRWVIADPEREEPTGGDRGAVLAALRVASAWAPALAGRSANVIVDSRPFLLDGKKLGIGRSAATVTAAAAAFLASAGHRDPAETLEAAVAAHALFQEGHGSGADVAATAHGGVIEFRRSAGRIQTTPRALPDGLELLVGWTGEPMPTDPLIKRFASAASTREPAALAALCEVAERAAAAAVAGDRSRFLAAVRSTAELLDRLGHEVGIPIVTSALARLIAAAERCGAAAKPSGAGGGDCGIAFATSPAQAEAIRAAWQAAGIVPLRIAIAPAGVRLEIDVAETHEVSVG